MGRRPNQKLIELCALFKQDHCGKLNKISLPKLAMKIGWWDKAELSSSYMMMAACTKLRALIYQARHKRECLIYSEGRVGDAGYYVPNDEDWHRITPWYYNASKRMLVSTLKVLEHELNATIDIPERIKIKDKIANIMAYMEVAV